MSKNDIPTIELSSDAIEVSSDAPEGIDPEVWANAQARAEEDRLLLEQVRAFAESGGEPKPAARRNPSLGENFVDMAQLLAKVKKETRLSEGTVLKLWELNLMWALNNRQNIDQNVYPEVDPEGGDEGEAELPTPHEVITGEPEETNE